MYFDLDTVVPDAAQALCIALPAPGMSSVLLRLEGRGWARVAIDEPLARRAGDIAVQHALRGYDAVHLACALQLHGDDILLATWGNALNAAARATGQLLAYDTA